MTSNLGSEVISSSRDEKKQEEVEKKLWDILHKSFRPEFLNRLDGVVIYRPLGVKEIMKISEIALQDVKIRLAENNINLEISNDLIGYFAEHGYDPVFGARPLKRLIEEKLVDEIAFQVIEGKIKPGDTVKPKLKDEKIVIN